MLKLEKQELEALRKAAGYGYAAGVDKILKAEHNYSVNKIQEIYDVAHGKNKDETILEAFLTYVIRKSKASTTVQSLASEALKLISPSHAA
ncbi:hypothetical protein [Nibribacter koreensis]|uniref:Uncharacterized protein n=1 Tax=Nibribacter koreensis TaxID=1084519 RepID=A0ABP8FB83_9BACT